MPAFSVQTLDGSLTVGGQGGQHLPLVAAVLDRTDPFSLHMCSSRSSLAAFLARAPPEVSFLFLSYADEPARAEADARWMRAQLLRAARGLRLTAAQREARLRRVHFVTQPALSVPGWLPRLLTDAAWLSPRRIVRATARDRGNGAEGVVARGLGAVPAAGAGGTPATDAHAGRSLQGSANRLKLLESGRLDAFYGWIPWALSGVSAPLAVAGTDCDWLPHGGGRASGGRGDAGRSSIQEAALPDGPPGSSLNGSVALITLTSLPGADPGWGSSGGQLCSYGAMLAAAEAAGAAAVLFAAPPGASLAVVNCTAPAECGTPVGLPASMVPHLVGEVLREAAEAGALVQLNFTDAQGPALFAGLDASGALFEPGWLKVPSLLHAVWAAQWQVYQHRLHSRLAEPALTVPVFSGRTMEGEHGLRASLAMPDARQLAGMDKLELYFELGCPGDSDASCPAWDHMVQLFACPEGELCQPCQPTVWLPRGAGNPAGPWGRRTNGPVGERVGRGGAAGAALPGLLPAAAGGGARSLAAASVGVGNTPQDGEDRGGAAPPLLCGREIGRWITPFRRRISRSLSDITPLRTLLPPGGRVTFTLQSTAWAGPWVPTLALRFSRQSGSCGSMHRTWADSADNADGAGSGDGLSGSSRTGGILQDQGVTGSPAAWSGAARRRRMATEAPLPLQAPPWAGQPPQERVLPLPFDGGPFDERYNSRHPPFRFATPARLARALLAVRITGHGSDEDGCGEFCPSTHAWRVNGRWFNTTFDSAGTLWGCADSVLEGTVPNEHGTWLYGRGGWCNGAAVPLHVVDITTALLPPSQPGGMPGSPTGLGSDAGSAGGAAGGAGADVNIISYRGEFRGASPCPQSEPGYMLMQSNLVFYFETPS